ncbi:MAG: histidine phosphatase family protein [Candidatus Saccharimonadales bacterium]
MKKLYFVRHGESYINIEDVFATKPGAPNDKGLTSRGKAQAQAGADKAAARHFKPDLVVASPLVRARETAEIIARTLGYPLHKIVISDLVVELQFGELEQTSWNAFWKSGKTYHSLADYEGAETIEQLQKRAERALAYLRSLPKENILVVSHSAFGRALKRAIDHESYTLEFKNKSSLPHGEILEYI